MPKVKPAPKKLIPAKITAKTAKELRKNLEEIIKCHNGVIVLFNGTTGNNFGICIRTSPMKAGVVLLENANNFFDLAKS